MRVTIYGLADPDEPTIIWYVGQTGSSLALRLAGHLSEPESTLEKGRKLLALKKAGQKPLIKALLRIKQEHGYAAERDMMRRLLEAGHPLINAEVLYKPKRPSVERTARWRKLCRERNRLWREAIRQDPERHATYLAAAADRKKRRKKSLMALQTN